jgi:ppGpp synthetase/RelA/SpoT-type nucleotidyltranferase
MKDFRNQYNLLYPKYESLKRILTFTLEEVTQKNNISTFSVEGRVKDIGSIEKKIQRKNYDNPLEQIEDICGIRIICYYSSDMDKIESIIKEHFNVISFSDKIKESADDQFGYLSRHYIANIGDELSAVPLYSSFEDMKFEIQVRTILMHTWAAISHKLLYKKESDAPYEIKRKLNRLSALIELADEQFDSIKELKSDYVFSVTNSQKVNNEPINSDAIVALVKKYSPGRSISSSNLLDFIDEIEDYNLTVEEFENKIKKCLPYINRLEMIHADSKKISLPVWDMSGFCRVIMDLTEDDYFHSRHDENPSSWFDGIIQIRQDMRNENKNE